jgi:glycine hydroxymethyltransferase
MQTGYIDMAKLEEKALEFRPKILIAGGSAYPREWDYAAYRAIADKAGALLMMDMAHIRSDHTLFLSRAPRWQQKHLADVR